MAEPYETGSNPNQSLPQEPDDALRNRVMVSLTAAFILLYIAALLGWIPPLPDDRVVVRLEAIVGVIIGYYFGRVPGEKIEKTLKEEVNRQAGKAKEEERKKEHAREEKASAEQAAMALEQKVRSTHAVLAPAAAPALKTVESDATAALRASDVPPMGRDDVRQTVAAAIRVLDS
jgi:hypothetical protein